MLLRGQDQMTVGQGSRTTCDFDDDFTRNMEEDGSAETGEEIHSINTHVAEKAHTDINETALMDEEKGKQYRESVRINAYFGVFEEDLDDEEEAGAYVNENQSIPKEHDYLANIKYRELTEAPENMSFMEYVRNWDHRIQHYSPEVKQIYEQLWETEKEFDALLSDQSTLIDWELCHDDQTPGQELKFEQATSPRGLQVLRIEAMSDFDPLTTFRCYGDRELRLEYDQNIQDCYAVKMIGCNLFESYQITKSALGILQSRDFYQYMFLRTNHDNS